MVKLPFICEMMGLFGPTVETQHGFVLGAAGPRLLAKHGHLRPWFTLA